jgi:hypothetical protein
MTPGTISSATRIQVFVGGICTWTTIGGWACCCAVWEKSAKLMTVTTSKNCRIVKFPYRNTDDDSATPQMPFIDVIPRRSRRRIRVECEITTLAPELQIHAATPTGIHDHAY